MFRERETREFEIWKGRLKTWLSTAFHARHSSQQGNGDRNKRLARHTSCPVDSRRSKERRRQTTMADCRRGIVLDRRTSLLDMGSDLSTMNPKSRSYLGHRHLDLDTAPQRV